MNKTYKGGLRQSTMEWACENGDTGLITDNINIQFGANPALNDSAALRLAAANGRTEMVKMLLEDGRVDPTAKHNYALRWAVTNGHMETTRLLLSNEEVQDFIKENPVHFESMLKYTEIAGKNQINKMLLSHAASA